MMSDYGPHRRGKSEGALIFAIAAYRARKTVFIATNNTAGMLHRLRRHLPRDLFEIRPGGILMRCQKK